MTQALISLSEDANRTVNVVKAKYGLKDKSEAIERIIMEYIRGSDDPDFNPEFLARIEKAQKGKFVKVSNFAKKYGI